MNKPPLAILISASSIKSGESDILADLFDIGLERLHLRKPESSPLKVAKLLDSIPQNHHKKIVIHRFPELLNDFSLGGYHHHGRESLIKNKENISSEGTISRSLHNLGELKDMSEPLDYCFFGPVYESISKKGYIPKISLPELGACLHTLKKAKTKKPLVYALGGVRRRKIPELFNLGFDGVTLLGSIWGKKDPVAAFEKYKYVERSSWAKKEKEKGLLLRLLEKKES